MENPDNRQASVGPSVFSILAMDPKSLTSSSLKTWPIVFGEMHD